jgi:hypothetical protein
MRHWLSTISGVSATDVVFHILTLIPLNIKFTTFFFCPHRNVGADFCYPTINNNLLARHNIQYDYQQKQHGNDYHDVRNYPGYIILRH